MDKFVHITDLHLANRQPIKRIDDYNEAIFKKLEYVVSFCKKNKVANLIITGDLSETANLSDQLMLRFVDIIINGGLQVYFVYGNHDIVGGSLASVQNTNFGLLEKYDWFHLVGQDVFEFQYSILAGYDYNKDMAVSNTWMFPKESAKVKILLTHPMITNEKTMIVDGVYKQIQHLEISTTADIMLCGHYHDGFPKPVEVRECEKKSLLINPGSLARKSLSDVKRGYGPRLAYIKVSSKGYRVKQIDIPCEPIDEVFDLKKAQKDKDSKEERDKFVKSLAKIRKGAVVGFSMKKVLIQLLKNPPDELKEIVSKDTIKYCKEKLNEEQ